MTNKSKEYPINHLKDDIKLLLDNNIISIDKDNNNLVRWNKDKLELDTQYNYLKKMCLNENVFMVDEVMLMWTFPVNIFNSFKEVYVLTYQFKGQIQKYYYRRWLWIVFISFFLGQRI